jgi:hypothetical protein
MNRRERVNLHGKYCEWEEGANLAGDVSECCLSKKFLSLCGLNFSAIDRRDSRCACASALVFAAAAVFPAAGILPAGSGGRGG